MIRHDTRLAEVGLSYGVWAQQLGSILKAPCVPYFRLEAAIRPGPRLPGSDTDQQIYKVFLPCSFPAHSNDYDGDHCFMLFVTVAPYMYTLYIL